MIRHIINNRLIPHQDFIFGFADLHGLLDKKFDGFPYGVSIGKRLEDSIIDKLDGGPTIEYYNYYCRINTELAKLTKEIQADLQQNSVSSMLMSGYAGCVFVYVRKGGRATYIGQVQTCFFSG